MVIAITGDAETVDLIRGTLEPLNVEVRAAADAEEGWDLLQHTHATAILMEATLANRARLLDRITNWDPGAPVLLLTDGYTEECAIDGIRHGACDCLSLPLSPARLGARIRELMEEARLRRGTLALDERLIESYRFHGMVGRSPLMLETFARIRRVAPHYRVALVTGATGTGKELVAHALHALSPVAHRQMVVCNCSAIVETLLESELFGHVRGAFTGASQDRIGLFEYAQGGTVFLDEIADMPLASQSKLLRVVQNQELQRVGSPEVRKVDVRVVAATNRDLRALVADNQFREDLYYRLAMVEVKLPRLGERREDLPLLERHFVERFSCSFGKRIGGISRRAQEVLSRHSWPGNIREMENVLGHACMMAESEFIDVRDLPDYLRLGTGNACADVPELVPLSALERSYTRHVLERVGGNKVQAAEILGISRATLYRILRDGAGEPAKPWIDFLGRSGSPSRLRVQ